MTWSVCYRAQRVLPSRGVKLYVEPTNKSPQNKTAKPFILKCEAVCGVICRQDDYSRGAGPMAAAIPQLLQ